MCKKRIILSLLAVVFLTASLFAAGTYIYEDKSPKNSDYSLKLNTINPSQTDIRLITSDGGSFYNASVGEDTGFASDTLSGWVQVPRSVVLAKCPEVYAKLDLFFEEPVAGAILKTKVTSANINSSEFISAQTKANLIALLDKEYLVFPANEGYLLNTGYTAYSVNNPRAYIYELYPGSSRAIVNDTPISFKVWSIQESDGTFAKGVDPSSVYISITCHNVSSSVESFTCNFQSVVNGENLTLPRLSPDDNLTGTVRYIEGEGVYYEFTNNELFSFGAEITVEITARYTPDVVANTTGLSANFKFKIAGVPFLGEIISDHSDQYDGNPAVAYGWASAGGQDINGDGFDDLVVSDPYYYIDGNENHTGVVYVYFGGPDNNITADIKIKNYAANDDKYGEFGYAVALGDINNDGYADIIIGQPSYGKKDGDNIEYNYGRVLVYFGGPSLGDGSSSVDFLKPSIIITNEDGVGGDTNPNPDLMGSLIAVGNINKNQDRYADIILKVGEVAHVIDGEKLYKKLSFPDFMQYPVPVDYTEVLVNSIQTGLVGGLNEHSKIIIYDRLREDIGSGSDENNAMIAISLPSFTEAQSKVQIHSYKSSWNDLRLAESTLRDVFPGNIGFGAEVACVGDINDDGVNDLVVGKLTQAAVGTAAYGRVIIYLGYENNYPVLYTFAGNDSADTYPGCRMIQEPIFSGIASNDLSQFGLVVSGVGDIDADGHADFIVGAPDFGESDVGAAYIFLGSKFDVSSFTEDMLDNFIIIGKKANAHLGARIVGLGDIDDDGYSDVLISELGYRLGMQIQAYSSAEFKGIPKGVRQPDVSHLINIHSNLAAIDHSAPILIKSLSKPLDGTVGWNPATEFDLWLADRGNAGLEFESLEISYRKKGVKWNDNARYRNYILKPRTFYSYSHLEPKYSELMDATLENLVIYDAKGEKQASFNDLTKWRSDGYDATTHGGGYIYDKKAKMINLKIKPTETFLNKRKFAYSEDYILDVVVRDRAGSSFERYGGLEYRTSVNFSIKQEDFVFVDSETNPNYSPLTVPLKGTFKSIGNFDGDPDGLSDFAYTDPEKMYKDNGINLGKVYVYWGSPSIDFAKAPSLVIERNLEGDTASKGGFGRFITHLNVDSFNSEDELVIAHNGGFWVINGGDYSKYRSISKLIVDDNLVYCNEVTTGSDIPGMMVPVRSKDRKMELLAVVPTGSSKIVLYGSSSGGFTMEEKVEILTPVDDGKIGALACGFFDNSDYQQIAVGLPDADGGNGKVLIYKVIKNEGVYTISQPIIIPNFSQAAGCGFSLAAGYFDDEFEKSVSSDGKITIVKNGYEDLAVGYPFDSKFAPTAGRVIIFKSDSNGINGITAPNATNPNTKNIVVLRPESKGDNFGYALAKINYLSSPRHYSTWGIANTTPYFDDADDLMVGAPGYDYDGSNTYREGKVYIYTGGKNLDAKPNAGYVGSSSAQFKELGSVLQSGGDLLDTNNDIIAVAGINAGRIALLRNRSIPDTTPPHIEDIAPEDHAYDVPVTANIKLVVSDISGIRDDYLNVWRMIDGEENYLVQAGVVKNNQFVLTANRSVDGTEVAYTISLNSTYRSPYNPVEAKPGVWNQSETVDLRFTVADDRAVWISDTERVENPLVKDISFGFVADFAKNEAEIPLSFTGQGKSNTFFAASMAHVGDVNGDGLDDFIVGEYGNNEQGFYAGKVYLFLGHPDYDEFIKPDAEMYLGLTGKGGQSAARFGWNVVPVGDMNGDGYDDVAIVGANSGLTGGEVFILFGNPDPRSQTARERTDGQGASIVLDPNNRVMPREWDNTYLERIAVCIQAEMIRDGLGNGIHGGGDINGDGYDDLVIGAPGFDDGATDTGRAYVIFGRSNMLMINKRSGYNEYAKEDTVRGPIKLSTLPALKTDGAFPSGFDIYRDFGFYIKNNSVQPDYDKFGSAILTGININGDETVVTKSINYVTVTKNIPYSEILISSVGHDSGRGRVDIYSYKKYLDGKEYLHLKKTIEGENKGEKFGYSLANLGDISADNNYGNPPRANNLIGQDFAVGAPGNNGPDPIDNPKYEVGAVYVFVASPQTTDDFTVTKNMFSFGQNQGDKFGYTVANVGNVDNDEYNNNDLAVAAPFFRVGDNADAGRVYIFATQVKNMGSDLNPNYQLTMDGFADFVAEGNEPGAMFGASICYVGDLDGDFVAEYIIGAPCGEYKEGGSPTYNNVGKATLFRNPDVVNPKMVDPMAYLVGKNSVSGVEVMPGNRKFPLVNYVGSGENAIPLYNELNFSLSDDRSIDLTSVLIEVDPVIEISAGKYVKDTRRYVFVPSKGDEAYYLIRNRKWSDFKLNLKNNIYYETTYNIRVYASDKSGNKMKYDYSSVKNFYDSAIKNGIAGFGSTVAERIPLYCPNKDLAVEGKIREYFQFSFVSGPNILAGPEIIINLLSSKNAQTSSVVVSSENALLELKLKDKLQGIKQFTIYSSPNVVVNNDTIAVGSIVQLNDGLKYNRTTTNILTLLNDQPRKDFYTGTDDIGYIKILDFPSGQPDGAFRICIEALDVSDNISTKNRVFFKDTQPPYYETVTPLAGATNAKTDGKITFKVKDNSTGVDIFNQDNSINYDKFKIYVSSGKQARKEIVSKNISLDILFDDDLVGESSIMPAREVTVTINGLLFEYEEEVSVNIVFKDFVGHQLIATYSFSVSPDYRAPLPDDSQGKAVELKENPYTDGELTISVNAKDDVAVAYVLFELIEETGFNGLVSDKSLQNPTSNFLRLSITPTKNYSGLHKLYIRGLGEELAKDGVQTIKVYFLDAMLNKSIGSDVSVKLDADSLDGGPIMPLVILDYPDSEEVPLFVKMPRYINTSSIDLYLSAEDPRVKPENAEIEREVAAYVLAINPADFRGSGTGAEYFNSPKTRTLQKYTQDGGYLKIDNFDISAMQEYQGGEEIVITVNFIDNDAGLSLNMWTKIFDDNNGKDLDPSDPTISSKNILYLFDLPATWTVGSNDKVHFCDEPFVITFNYDITPPVLGGLYTGIGGLAYSDRTDALQIGFTYHDYWKNNNVTENPINDIYYQIICEVPSGNSANDNGVQIYDKYLYVDVKGSKELPIGGSTDQKWRIKGNYYNSNGLLIDEGENVPVYDRNGYALFGTVDYNLVNDLQGYNGTDYTYSAYGTEIKAVSLIEQHIVIMLNPTDYPATTNTKISISYKIGLALRELRSAGKSSFVGESGDLLNKIVGQKITGTIIVATANETFEFLPLSLTDNFRRNVVLKSKIGLNSDDTYTDNKIFVKYSGEENTPLRVIEVNLLDLETSAIEDDLLTTDFFQTSMGNWTNLNVANAPNPGGIQMGDLTIPATLSENARYYFRVVAKDLAGNYSKIMTSNYFYVDKTAPVQPLSFYNRDIVLNRNVFKFNLLDNISGIRKAGVKIDSASSTYSELSLVGGYGKETLVNGRLVNDYVKNYQEMSFLEDSFWDNLPQKQSLNLYFRVEDPVGNFWVDSGTAILKFKKDIMGPVVKYNFSNAVKYKGKDYINSDRLKVDFVIADAEAKGRNLLAMSELPLSELIVKRERDSIDYGYEPLLLAGKDWSFEEAGDRNLTVPIYWQKNAESIYYNYEIALLNSADIEETGAAFDDEHCNGIYGLVVSFNITPSNFSGEYVWDGIAATFNTVAASESITYTVGLMLNINRFANIEAPLLGTAKDDGGFGLRLDAREIDSVYSNKRVNNKSIADWQLVTAAITVPASINSKVVTVNLVHLKNGATVPFQFDSTNVQSNKPAFNQQLLIDSFLVVNGNTKIVQKGDSIEMFLNEYAGPDIPVSYFAYDAAGNVSTGSPTVRLDNTAPSWNASGTESVLLPYNEKIIVTTNIVTTANEPVEYFVNAIQKNENNQYTGYLAARFKASEPESEIRLYEYEIYSLTRGEIVDTGVWSPGADGAADIKIQVPLTGGNKYLFKARAQNCLGQYSDWITANGQEFMVDNNAPTVSLNIEESLKYWVTQDAKYAYSGWYKDSIAITVNARDIYQPSGEIYYGGVGVKYIRVVTCNALSDVLADGFTGYSQYDVSLMPSASIVVTLNLSAEGANNLAVWAVDRYGYESEKIIVTKNLYIDREPPLIKSEELQQIVSFPGVDEKWQSENLEYTISVTDMLGDGTKYVYLRLNDAVTPDFFTLDVSSIGNKLRGFMVDENNPDNRILIIEGKTTGFFDRNLIDKTTREKLRKAGIVNTYAETDSVIFWTFKGNDLDFYENLISNNIREKAETVFDIWKYKTTDKQDAYFDLKTSLLAIKEDGFHKVELWAEDKFGHTSNVREYKHICLDTGNPDVLISMGGSFQSVWSLEDIVIKLNVFDMFANPFLVSANFYADGTVVPESLRGLEVTRPGSGVAMVGLAFNTTSNIMNKWHWFDADPLGEVEAFVQYQLNLVDAAVEPSQMTKTRFGFSINEGFLTNDNYTYVSESDYRVDDYIITRNGINMFAYRVIDKAGNASQVNFCQDPENSKVWDEVLNTYFYPGDNSIIRGIKIDTLPPYEGKVNLTTASWTDTEINKSNYPLYTNKPEVDISFGAKDDGIGVKYGIIVCEQNINGQPDSLGLTYNAVANTDVYLTPFNWVTINAIKPFLTDADRHPVNKEQGILNYANEKRIVFGELQGTRNMTMYFSDDFGFPYKQKMSSVEEMSVTFDVSNYDVGSNKVAGVAVTVNFVPLEVAKSGQYRLMDQGSNSYFAWNGVFDVPTENFNNSALPNSNDNPKLRYGNGLGEEWGYKVTTRVLDSGSGTVTINIYSWDETMPQHLDHRGATTDVLVVVYDNILNPTTITMNIPEIRQDIINGVTADFVNAPAITVQFKHDETEELSGITHVMFSGKEISASSSPNKWLTYQRFVTNNYTLLLDEPESDGWVTINISGLRDRAGNILNNITANTQVKRFYYDRSLPLDNLNIEMTTARVRLKDQQSGRALNGQYLVDTVDFLLEMNMKGANEYIITELTASGTENILSRGDYADLLAIDPNTRTVPFSLTTANRIDGLKDLKVRFFDRGYKGNYLNDHGESPTASYTELHYHFLIDNTAPKVTVKNLNLDNFYTYEVNFSLLFDDLAPSADYVSGLDKVYIKINNGTTINAFDSRNQTGIERATINVKVVTSGFNNEVKYLAIDHLGNQLKGVVSGIKLNAIPPTILSVAVAKGYGRGWYVNTTGNIELEISAIGTTYFVMSGDVKHPGDKLYSYGVKMDVTLTDGDGVKEIVLTAMDQYTALGGPSETRVVTLHVDTEAPLIPTVNTNLANIINVIHNGLYISGTKEDPGVYPSGCQVYAAVAMEDSNGEETILNEKLLTEELSETEWRVSLIKLVRQFGPRTYKVRFYAEDKATNVSVNSAPIKFEIPGVFVLGGSIKELDDGGSLAINALESDDVRVERAKDSLKGVQGVSSLEKTITEFNMRDQHGNYVHEFNSTEDVNLVIQYSEAAGKEGTPASFRIYCLNEITGQWEIVEGEQKVDKENRTVEVKINHFSIYRIFSTVDFANNLKNVHVFPNPYKPNDGNVSTGEDGHPVYGRVTFQNITKTSKVKIYTISGELVNSLEPVQSDGSAYWSLDNKGGERVASGIYVYVINDAEGHKKVGRITVVR